MISNNKYTNQLIFIFGLVLSISISNLSAQVNNQKLKIGFPETKPIFYINDNGEADGYYLNIFKGIAKTENWEVEYVSGSFNELIEKLENGEIDILLRILKTEIREKNILFNNVALYMGWSEIVVNNDSKIESFLDLNNKKIAARKNTNAVVGKEGILEKINEFGFSIDIVNFETKKEIINALITNKVDAIIVGRSSGISILEENDFKRTGILLAPGLVLTGISKRNPNAQKIANAIDKRLTEIINKTDSKVYKEFENYLNISYVEVEFIPDWLKWSIFLGSGLLIFVFVNSMLLNYKVKEKEIELKKSFKKLIENENLLKTTQKVSKVGGWELNLENKKLLWSDEVYNIHELPLSYCPNVEEAITFYIPEHRDIISNAVQNAIDKNEPWDLELKIVTASSKGKWVRAIGKSTIENDKTRKLIGTFQDIHEKKINDEIIRNNEQLLNSIIDNTSAVIFVKNKNGNYILINKQFENLFHLKKENIIDKSDYDLFPIEKAEELKINDLKVLNSGEIHQFEELIPQDDGIHHYISIKFPLLNLEGELYAICGISTDITEYKNLEEQLFQSQKLEALGRLAGGIAHDFNNIVGGIRGHAELMKSRLKNENSKNSNSVDIILESVLKAKDLTSQLLGFAREGKYNPSPININHIISQTIDFSKVVFDKKVSFSIQMDQNINNIEADAHQMGQVFTNLIINAKDAMPNGGKITIITENVYLDSKEISGNYVCIKLRDTGEGISLEDKEKIFEPFFTTKDIGKGTGLGLSTVYGIIKNHNGYINVVSELSIGTTFNIYLPVTEKEQLKTNRMAIMEKSVQGKTILIVDDDEIMRNANAEIVEELGYNFILAESGKSAIDKYTNNNSLIDLILMDNIMPGMDGLQTFTEIAKINPDAKVIMISGYSKESVKKRIIGNGVLGFIQKPFSMEELANEISICLEN